MPALSDPRGEAFARALAMGDPPGAAVTAAGYGRRFEHGRLRAAKRDIAARANELSDELSWGEAGGDSAMIKALMRLAGMAGRMGTPAAMTAARGLVAEAAKLSGRTPDRGDPDDAQQIDPCFRPLSEEDWVAKYGHLANRAP